MLSLAKILLALIAVTAASVHAQGYPAKPVRVVVPFPPGQATEIVGRLFAERLAENLKAPFTIEHRPGAGGAIGTEAVAKAPADGYTLLVTASGTMVINPHLYRNLAYDPARDFVPIALLGIFPLVSVVHPSVAASSVAELIGLARARPGQINFASSGPGTAQHLAGEMFKFHTGVNIVHVPYKGSGPAVSDLIGGHVNLMFDTVVSSLPQIQAGKVRALAVTSAQRSSALPDLPTMVEAGIADMVAVGWAGILAPAGTPREIVARLNGEIANLLGQSEVRTRLLALGCEPASGSPEDFARTIRTDSARWAQAIKAAGVRLD